MPARQREPHPALQSLLDAPLKLSMSSALSGRIDTLRSAVRAAASEEDQVRVYDDAIDVTEALLAEMDAQMDALERDSLALGDPGELRGAVAGRRKAADEVRVRVRNDVKGVLGEWADRLKRQQGQVDRQAVDWLDAHFAVSVRAQGKAVEVAVSEADQTRVVGFLDECTRAWSAQACEGASEQLAKALEARLEAPGADRVPWRAPPAPEPPALDVSAMRVAPPETGAAPSTLGALGSFLRSNVMLVSMFGMLLGAPVALVFGIDIAAGGSGLLRGLVVVAALPFLVAIGLFAGVAKRREAIGKLERDSRKKLRDATDRSVREQLERHRGALERWVRARATQLEQALDEWWKVAIEPALERAEADGAEAMQRAKLDQRRLGDEHGRLKRTREDIAGKLLFDLKRTRRSLSEGSG